MNTALNKTMEMPSSYALMDNEEMAYVEGGFSMKINKSFLLKQNCKNSADFFLGVGAVKNMTTLQLAQELFAHAMIYYNAKDIRKMGIDGKVIDYLIRCGEYVDIDDGGDVWYRQLAYSAIWGGKP